MIWTREELGENRRAIVANHVKIMSDEIYCDLTEPGYGYIPFASVSETCAQNSVTCIAQRKPLIWLVCRQQLSWCQTKNYVTRWSALNTDEVAEPNAFAIEAAIAAFTKGEGWLDALREYLAENRKNSP